jgi:hypothetical protein
MKPTSIPEHNRTAEIQKLTNVYNYNGVKNWWILVAFPFIILWRIFKN